MRELTRSLGDAVFENLGRAAGRVQEETPLPADLLESEDAYLVVFDAPGARASDVQVRYVEDRVEVQIDRFRDFFEGFEMRYPGRGLSLEGTVALPDDAAVNADDATATLREDGTLHVRVPKARGSPGTAGEGDDDRVSETVEEADERAEAGADVPAEEPDDESADARQDETDAESDMSDDYVGGDEGGEDDEE